MYCNACGTEFRGRYCHNCGRPNPGAAPGAHRQPLERPREGRKIAGVCLALARGMDWDPTLVRVLWVVASIFGALVLGAVAYVVAWIVIPEEPLVSPAGAPKPSPTQGA